MTPKQRRVYDFILAHWKLHGFGPTYEEICEGVGLKSRGAVHALVKRMRDEGTLTAASNRTARQLVPTELLVDARIEHAVDHVRRALRAHDAGEIGAGDVVSAMRDVPGILRARQ